jgi:hypothetical protein
LAYISKTKEQLEIEAALTPSSSGEVLNVQGLPEELLSIIVDTSFFHDPEDSGADIVRRRTLEGYLMSWSLIFHHFVDSVLSHCTENSQAVIPSSI